MNGEELLARVKAKFARQYEEDSKWSAVPVTFGQALLWHADAYVARMTNEELIKAIGDALNS